MADDSRKKTTSTKKVRASTGAVRRNPPADQTNWRVQLRASKVKFDDIQKTIFLEALLEHGQQALAAKAAQVCMQTVRDHKEIDPEFGELFDAVLEERARRIIKQLESEALNGHTQPIYDKDGNHIGDKIVYETRLREMMMKRFDDAYRDRQEIDLKGGGGVLVVPGEQSAQDWIADQVAKNASREPPPKILPSGDVVPAERE